MDSLIDAAAHALAHGDPLGALKRVALRDDAPSLALRGIAMAQLGEFDRAKKLLGQAGRAFGPKESVARARCVVAEIEIALVSRDLGWPAKKLSAARTILEAHGDHVNAAHARYLEARRQLLFGHLDDAEQTLAGLDPAHLPPAFTTIHELIVAGIAMRRVRAKAANAALVRAERAALRARVPALAAEVESAFAVLRAPAARSIVRGGEKILRLDEIETLFVSTSLIVDANRYVVRDRRNVVSLARRPVLFALARVLGEHWPDDVPRDVLVATAFRGKRVDESYRSRLRVEIGRLRKELRSLADIVATSRGFILVPHRGAEVVVLAQPFDAKHADVLALLGDGERWSSSSIAVALGTGQRTMQRALDALAAVGKVQAFGHGRARRWTTPPIPGFATTLLLPAPLPGD
jgi:hypothetical protein